MKKKSDSIKSFLNPQSIAILGATPEAGKLRGMLTKTIVKNGYQGRLYFINPSHKQIYDLPCYPDVHHIQQPIDLAIIVLPAPQVLEATEQCAQIGVKNALIMSSGFAEEGGAQSDAQVAIRAISDKYGMRISGPNAEGFHNEINRVSATFSPAVDLDLSLYFQASQRNVAIVAQSGGMGFSLYHRGRKLGLTFSHVITTGNEVDLTAADFLNYLVDDDDTSAIVLFLETIRNAPLFLSAAARAVSKKKPIVVVKVGQSTAGSLATVSHTGAMAGWNAAYEAAFEKVGVVSFSDIDHALAFVAISTTSPLLHGHRAAIVTVSGGGGALVADALSNAGFECPTLAEETQKQIRAIIPSYGSTQNPVDVTGQATRTGAPLKTIQLLESGDEVDLVMMVSTMANTTRPPVDPIELSAVIQRQKKPVLFYSYTLASDFGLRALASASTVTFMGLTSLSEALREYVKYSQFKLPVFDDAQVKRFESKQVLPNKKGNLTEYESKQILKQYGFNIAPMQWVEAQADLNQLKVSLPFPLVAKMQSSAIVHKTEVGGVALQIVDQADLIKRCVQLKSNANKFVKQSQIDGILLEPMAAKGVELILGSIRDETFGAIISVGAGGTMAEIHQDVVRRTAPVSTQEALSMLRQLKSFALLDGFRGSAKSDVNALCQLIADFSLFAHATQEQVLECEVNPVMVHPVGQGCTIIDAMMVLD